MTIVAEHTESRILAIVHERGCIALEELPSCLPESTWNQIFASVDTLSRRDAISLRREGYSYRLRALRLPDTTDR